VLSVPADAAAELLNRLDQDLAKLLRGVQYTPMTVVHTGFDRHAVRHPLDGTGFLIPHRVSVAATGCLWMSSLFPDRAPPGKILLTNYLGGARLPEAVEWDDFRSLSQILKVISPLLGIRGDPEMVRIDRHHSALPLYHGRYHGRMRAITDRLQQLPGLHLEANYRGGVSVRDRIACAYNVAKRIAAEQETPYIRSVGSLLTDDSHSIEQQSLYRG
jgi:oxygen-dependent protoporphyrinogen oxidase